MGIPLNLVQLNVKRVRQRERERERGRERELALGKDEISEVK